MAINITSRIRNAMIGLSIGLCILFTGLIFLLAYVIEDQVFLNQIKLEKARYEQVMLKGDSELIETWRPSTPSMQRIEDLSSLPYDLPSSKRSAIDEQAGVHEYFSDGYAIFITRLDGEAPSNRYLVYDVSDLLVVSGTKASVLVLIGLIALFAMLLTVVVARRLTKSTLAPVVSFTKALKTHDLDDVVIDMAKEFSEDEISVLTQELAKALERMNDFAKKQYEFNRGVSHELRSPIQAAQSAIELLQALEETESKPLQRLQRSVTEMNEVAEAFLWLSSNRSLEKDEWCTVKDINRALSNMPLKSGFGAINVTNLAPTESAYPIPQPVMITIVKNLVRNAVLHGDGASIRIELNQNIVSVINPKTDSDENQEGFGVGLSIVRGLCARFDSQLETNVDGDKYSAQISFYSVYENPSKRL